MGWALSRGQALAVATILVTVGADLALAQDRPPLLIHDPEWAKQPSPRSAANAYPMKAMVDEKTGVAVVRCVADAEGRLADCAVVCETPERYGFGKAALSLGRLHRLKPRLADGRSVAGGVVTIPIYFFPSFLPRPHRCDGVAD